jgi:hypothetical protein
MIDLQLRNNQRQALSHFGEVHSLYTALHSLALRADNDVQLKALLPLIIPKIVNRINTLVSLGIYQWKNETPDVNPTTS